MTQAERGAARARAARRQLGASLGLDGSGVQIITGYDREKFIETLLAH